MKAYAPGSGAGSGGRGTARVDGARWRSTRAGALSWNGRAARRCGARRTGAGGAVVARGATSAATRLGMRAEQVRRWRSAPRSGGIAALRPRPGRAPRKREAALAVAREVLAGPAADRPAWTLARLAAEVAARTGATISPGHPSVVLRTG